MGLAPTRISEAHLRLLMNWSPFRPLYVLAMPVAAYGCGIGGTDTIDLGGTVRVDESPPDSGATTIDAAVAPTCQADSDCTTPTPHCEPTSGACVECLAPEDCGAINLTCDATTHACVDGCSADAACPADFPYCHAPTGVCLVCTEDVHCGAYGDDSMCDVSLNRCVDCITDADCPFSVLPFCEPNYRECVGCRHDSDCPTGQHCEGPAGAQRCAL